MKKQLELVEFGSHEAVYRTNIDSIPFLIIDEELCDLVPKQKYTIRNNEGLYTLSNINFDKKLLEFKLDKTLPITEQLLDSVQSYYNGFGIKKTAKCNYVFGGNLEFDIDGKLSKNQTVNFNGQYIKITELIKLEDKTTEFKGVYVESIELRPIYPYREFSKDLGWYTKEWYYDWGDTLLKKALVYLDNKGSGF